VEHFDNESNDGQGGQEKKQGQGERSANEIPAEEA
jgi:hypothetical protein